MIVKYLKSNNASAYVFIPLFTIVLWLFGYIRPVELPSMQHAMPLYELLAGPIAYIWPNITIALVLIIIEAFFLNYIVQANEVLTRLSYLPAALYVILMSSNKAMFFLHPLIFGNLFLLLALHRMLSSYREDKAYSSFFDAGLCISVASLFYFPYLFFIPVIGAALVIMRAFSLREWLIAFTGIMVPYILIGTYYFLYDQLDILLYDKMLFYFSRKLHLGVLSKSFYFTNVIQLCILILAGGRLFTGLNTGTQKTKKGIILLIWFLLAGIASIAITQEINTYCFTALAIPIAIFYAHYFINLKRSSLAEILFLLFLGSVIIHLISSI